MTSFHSYLTQGGARRPRDVAPRNLPNAPHTSPMRKRGSCGSSPPPAAVRIPSLARRASVHAGFTLIELLITMLVIAILTSAVLAGLFAAQESAKAARTKGTITKLHNQIMHTWESYRTRRLPINMRPKETPRAFAMRKLVALWETQRIQMPDNYDDISFTPSTVELRPSPPNAYNANDALRVAYFEFMRTRAATPENGSAECLYLTIALSMNTDSEIRFLDGEIDDTDNDGMPEFVDGWGRPISWMRWAPGYIQASRETPPSLSPAPVFVDTDFQLPDLSTHPDPFDPLGVGRSNTRNPLAPMPASARPQVWGFKLVPLIYSAGPDGEVALYEGFEAGVAWNPYAMHDSNPPPLGVTPPLWRGTPINALEGGGHLDNITNHRLGNR